MKRLESSHGTIELTDERLDHILMFHPEVRGHLKFFSETLARPQSIVLSRRDHAVKIFYSGLRRKRRLAIVVKTNQRNFILTAYLTSK